MPFCEQVATALVDIFEQPNAGIDYHQLRTSTGLQPKASKSRPVVPEHKRVVVVKAQSALFKVPCLRMERLRDKVALHPSCQCELRVLPEGSQLLHLHSSGNKVDSLCVSVWGIPYSPSEFIKAALSAGHPGLAASDLPSPLAHAIKKCAQSRPEELARERTDLIRQWAARAHALDGEERAFKQGLRPEVAKILAPKRLLLWRELLQQFEYPDQDVFSLITAGVTLTGEVECSGLFNSVNRPATMSTQQLRESASTITAEALAQTRPQSPEVDEEVLRKTEHEVQQGWLHGPIPLSELPHDSVVSWRFGLVQGEKVRLIDDLRPVNQTVATFESPRPRTVDILASMGKSMMLAAPGVPLLGKAYDLTAAHRQLPLHPCTYWNSFISVWNHVRREPSVYQLRALPFGASKSVYSFLRTSHSLWWLACTALSIVWSLYYDDFICLSSSKLAGHTDNCVRAFFFLLGWQFSSSGDKHMDFSQVFTALGVTVQLASCLDGRLTISNTAKRIKELVESIRSIISTESLTKTQALKLRGRMQFAEGQLFGRVGRLCLRAVSDHAYLAATATTSASCTRALARFAKMLESAMPRTIKVGWELPWYVFTDASYDPSSSTWPCGVGGIILNAKGELVAAFSALVPKSMRVLLGETVKDTIIFEAEVVALICAMRQWRGLLSCKPTLFFVDNNAARDIAISGNARSPIANKLLDMLLLDEYSAEILAWFQRVPSPSNPADAPSRALLKSVALHGVEVQCEDISDLLMEVENSLKGC